MFAFLKKQKRMEDEISYLKGEILNLKKVLQNARIARFVKVIPYSKGMKLRYEQPPPMPIPLEELQTRIEYLESKRRNGKP